MESEVNNTPASGAGQLLEELKRATPEAVSGTALSHKLGISRTAVWKRIEALRRLGYQIQSMPRVGYRLARSSDRLYPWEIAADLDTTCFGRTVHYFESTGSTQDEARRLAEMGSPEGTIAVAEEQRAPRGRLRRAYFTPTGGLWFSLAPPAGAGAEGDHRALPYGRRWHSSRRRGGDGP